MNPHKDGSDEWYEWHRVENDKQFSSLPLESQGKNKTETDEELEKIIGCEIVNVGFHPRQSEGGLTLEYKKDNKIMRIVLGYTELGLWIAWHGEKKD
jgi:hypothetical protein